MPVLRARIPKPLASLIEEYARKKGLTVSDYVRIALIERLLKDIMADNISNNERMDKLAIIRYHIYMYNYGGIVSTPERLLMG